MKQELKKSYPSLPYGGPSGVNVHCDKKKQCDSLRVEVSPKKNHTFFILATAEGGSWRLLPQIDIDMVAPIPPKNVSVFNNFTKRYERVMCQEKDGSECIPIKCLDTIECGLVKKTPPPPKPFKDVFFGKVREKTFALLQTAREQKQITDKNTNQPVIRNP